MEGHVKKCVAYGELANKTTEYFSKSQRHVRMIMNKKKKKTNQWENYPQFVRKLL